MVLDDNDVRRAFEEDEFFPLFQPIVELKTGRLAGFEVLARWNHARLGRISPDAFVPIVLNAGLINTLTERLLRRMFAAAPLLADPLRLSFNLAPPQLLDRTLPRQIQAAAHFGGFPLHRLTVEMTGSAIYDDLASAQAVACELKALGCRLALDDFGTEHSSLHHLEVLPLDELKVDRSLIHRIALSPECRKIVAAIVGMAESLGLEAAAVGVESVEQAEILNWLGCNLGQGWHYGKPAPAAEIPRMAAALQGVSRPLPPVAEIGPPLIQVDFSLERRRA